MGGLAFVDQRTTADGGQEARMAAYRQHGLAHGLASRIREADGYLDEHVALLGSGKPVEAERALLAGIGATLGVAATDVAREVDCNAARRQVEFLCRTHRWLTDRTEGRTWPEVRSLLDSAVLREQNGSEPLMGPLYSGAELCVAGHYGRGTRGQYFDRFGCAQSFEEVVLGLRQTHLDYQDATNGDWGEDAEEGAFYEIRMALVRCFATSSESARQLEQKVDVFRNYAWYLISVGALSPVLESALVADCAQLGLSLFQFLQLWSSCKQAMLRLNLPS